MNVWRIHLKNDIASDLTREQLLIFCKKEKLVGVGWREIKTRDESKITEEGAKHHSKSSAAIKAVNAMSRMQIGDLVWTRLDNKYYLCKVTGLWKDSKPVAEHYRYDISNYVNVEWLEIGPQQDVPGKIISSFRASASAQAIKNVENISKYMWNHYSKTKTYDIEKQKMDIWTALPAEQIEELVLLYLQVEKGYYIYSDTVKHNFEKYECILVNKSGKHAYPQVKSGGIALDANDYTDAFNYDNNAEVYLFATSEDYSKIDCKDIHYITKSEMETFIKNNSVMLRKLTKNWLNLCEEFYK